MKQAKFLQINKLSALIDVALADLRKAEQTPGYKVNMGDWHVPEDNLCEVCLAGSVMAFTLEVPAYSSIDPCDMPIELKKRMLAINSLREGNVRDAFTHMEAIDAPDDWDENTRKFSRDIVDYEDNPEQFHKEMKKLSKDLKQAGL